MFNEGFRKWDIYIYIYTAIKHVAGWKMSATAPCSSGISHLPMIFLEGDLMKHEAMVEPLDSTGSTNEIKRTLVLTYIAP